MIHEYDCWRYRQSHYSVLEKLAILQVRYIITVAILQNLNEDMQLNIENKSADECTRTLGMKLVVISLNVLVKAKTNIK